VIVFVERVVQAFEEAAEQVVTGHRPLERVLGRHAGIDDADDRCGGRRRRELAQSTVLKLLNVL
jgi:hypothetical protein